VAATPTVTTVLSAPATAAYYAARNHITASPIVSAVASPTRTERCTVEQSAYRQQGRAPVALYTIRGGGHTIPGGNVEVMHCYR
jgi:polyhydroxybutyrate depolymerase